MTNNLSRILDLKIDFQDATLALAQAGISLENAKDLLEAQYAEYAAEKKEDEENQEEIEEDEDDELEDEDEDEDEDDLDEDEEEIFEIGDDADDLKI